MAYIIRNKTASPIDIDDLGIRLRASGDRDITIIGLGEIYDSLDLEAYIVAGDIAVLDANLTELDAAASLTAAEGAIALGAGGAGIMDNEYLSLAGPIAVTISAANTFVDVIGATFDIETAETGPIWAMATFNGLSPSDTTVWDARLVINGVNGDPVNMRLETANIRDNHIQYRSASLPAGTYTVKLQLANTENTNNGKVDNLNMFAIGLAAPAGADGADGADGATGPAGSGSSITVQEEGVNVAGGPHSTINIIGDNVTATDAGSGVADITITGGGSGSSTVDRQSATAMNKVVTTSRTLVDLADMTLTTNDLGEAGTYVITFSCDWETENDDKENQFTLFVDGSEVTSRHQTSAKKNKYNSTSLTHLAEGVASGTVIKVQIAQGDNDSNTNELTVKCRELIIDGTGDSNVL